MKRLAAYVGTIVTAAIAAAPGVASACAMCGLSPGDHAGHAYNTSVLFMLSGPYITFGLIGSVVYLAWRRSKRNELAETESKKR